MKPFIGLTPLYDDDKKSYWILPGYMEEIEHVGGIPVMLPLDVYKRQIPYRPVQWDRCLNQTEGLLRKSRQFHHCCLQK